MRSYYVQCHGDVLRNRLELPFYFSHIPSAVVQRTWGEIGVPLFQDGGTPPLLSMLQEDGLDLLILYHSQALK